MRSVPTTTPTIGKTIGQSDKIEEICLFYTVHDNAIDARFLDDYSTFLSKKNA